MKRIVFFVFDPSPRIEKRIEAFVDAGFDVKVYGYRHEKEPISYCNSDKYEYEVLETYPQFVSYKRRIKGLKHIIKIVNLYNKKDTLFYFFSLNVAIIAPFLRIKYIYEESDMLFDRFNNKYFRKATIFINKTIIKRSLITVMTSTGFADYYYGNHRPQNIVYLLNKVNPACLRLPYIDKEAFNENRIRFAFVGNIRYQSLIQIAETIAKKFPNHEFHFYGNSESLNEEQLNIISSYPNILKYGTFKNPDDLPEIYSNIDVLVCTYDIQGVNPRYAEPNKLYEAIFYRTPIVVSPNSFLEKKVKDLGVGLSVDAYSEEDVVSMVNHFNLHNYLNYITNLKQIVRESVINDNSELFNRIKTINDKKNN